MSTAADHLEAWERAGLIDQATADRVRAAEAADAAAAESMEVEPGELLDDHSPGASSLFGPPVAIAEVFAYLGVAFLLGGWFTWIATQSTHADNAGWVIGIGASAAAFGLGIVGAVLSRGGERMSRAAGVAFLVGLASVGTAAVAFLGGTGLEGRDVAVVASATTLAFAIACRAFHPALLTQIGLLSALTSLVGAALSWFEQALFPGPVITDGNLTDPGRVDPIVLVLGSAAWWLAVAVTIGLLGFAESRIADQSGDATAGRRAGLTRFWAGMVAVAGVASAVSRSDFQASGEYGRVVAPWIGDLGLLLLSAVLIERAFQRESRSYVYAAALGLIVALSDLNISYLTGGIELALLVEGLILLAAAVAADRLRRRVGRVDGEPPPGSDPDDGVGDDRTAEVPRIPKADT
jgi:hypothetical protein